MTFTEAAIEVLRREGKPLHFKKLTEIAVRENLLDHVGKVPDDTMADQLAAHCRLPRPERRIAVVQPGTFALVEWDLEEDPAGLENLVEAPPEGELPYRSRERHPTPSRELARSTGRTEARPRRREEEERRGRRFPPPAEVAYEILAGAGRPLGVAEIAANGAERLLMPEAFVREPGALTSALTEDNRRREGAGRKPLFQLDGDTVTLVAQPEPGERAVPVAPRVAAGPGDLRRVALAALRRRLRDCDGPTVEHVAMRLLEKLGFKDLKVAKRGREHVVCTARLRMGLGDVRHAIRILRGGTDAIRRDVSDLRRDLGHYGAQLGVVVTPGEAARDARSEAAAAGQLPIVLLCGEALAEALADEGVGCAAIVVPEVDETFFRAAAETAARDEASRRARREERDRREGREPRREEPAAAGAEDGNVLATVPADGGDAEAEPTTEPHRPLAAAPARSAPEAEPDRVVAVSEPLDGEDDGEEGDEEGPEGEASEGVETQGQGGAPAAGEGAGGPAGARRRRRRRRRRGGRGRGREGAPAEGGAPAPGSAPGEAGADAATAGGRPEGAPQDAPIAAPPPRAEPQPQPPPLPPRDPPVGEGA